MSTTTGVLQTTYPRRKQNRLNGLITDRLNFTNNTRTIHVRSTDHNRRFETDLWLMANLTRVFQPILSWLNWPISFNEPDIQHHRPTNTIHPTPKTTSAQAVETSVTNTSSPQNHLHPDDHTIRTTNKFLLSMPFNEHLRLVYTCEISTTIRATMRTGKQ